MLMASSQLMEAKNGCDLISSASPFPEPNLFAGFLCSSYEKIPDFAQKTSFSFTAFINDFASAESVLGSFNGAFSIFWNSSSLANPNSPNKFFFVPIVGVVGRDPDQQLIHDHAQQVPVDCLPMPAALEHLGGQVRHRAAEGPRALAVVQDALLAQPEVGQLGVPVDVQHDVVGLQVPENDVALVQVLQGEHDLGQVHADAVLVESEGSRLRNGEQGLLLLLEMLGQVAAGTVVQDQEQLVCGLEGAVQLHDEGVVRDAQHVALGHGVLDQIVLWETSEARINGPNYS